MIFFFFLVTLYFCYWYFTSLLTTQALHTEKGFQYLILSLVTLPSVLLHNEHQGSVHVTEDLLDYCFSICTLFWHNYTATYTTPIRHWLKQLGWFLLGCTDIRFTLKLVSKDKPVMCHIWTNNWLLWTRYCTKCVCIWHCTMAYPEDWNLNRHYCETLTCCSHVLSSSIEARKFTVKWEP